MKKFTDWVGALREAEKKQQSDLQKSYQEYFKAKLEKYGVESPADLDEEKKKEFFNEISADWESGKGVKPEAKEEMKKEEEEADKKETEEPSEEVGKLKGNPEDKMEDLTKVKESEVAEEVNEGALAVAGGILLAVLGLKVIRGIFNTVKGVKTALDLKKITSETDLNELVDTLYKEAAERALRSGNGKETMQYVLWASGAKSMIAKGEIKDGYELAKTLLAAKKLDPKAIFEGEEFEDVNESFAVVGGIILSIVGLKVLRDLAKKLFAKIGKGIEQTPEDLKKFVEETYAEAASELAGSEKSKAEAWKEDLISKIDAGEIKTLGDVEKHITNTGNIFA